MRNNIYKVFFFVLGIVTLGYMIYKLGVEEIWSSLLATGWWFIPVLLSWLVIYLMNAMALRDIVVEKNNPKTFVPFGKIFQLIVSGFSINYITPFVALGGEPYRIMELKRYVGGAKAGSSVLLYTMMHILSHLVFWVLSVGLIIWFVPINTTVLIACVLILLMAILLGGWFAKVYQHGIAVSSVSVLSRFPLIGAKMKKLGEEKHDLLEDIDRQVSNLYSGRRSKFYSALAWEFFARVVGCAEIYFIAHAVGVEMTYMESLLVSSGSSLFANLIFFLPMQLGTREGGMAMAMASIGYAADIGVFIGIATRIRECVWIAIGLFMMTWTKRKRVPQMEEKMSIDEI
ncbi:lysylphosphatidylglycerol synthase transmembrane domain-containing protein [Sphingobacterium psychroaquaticum]|uniref:Uncharacterized membrane protein YbhN, UPF0104 family n=1 Tax=Sphingobacterium psychroaquaticum TaxID=561061 RepID=A0A1X7I905_9SPHI|nr:lysylphosphatidylglycerol synthase transmembrane domain-containing protein [Sphingobacterium psychroaquaticum]SMG10856.1 Uncharacterized membrane protein YbhN, UPF0104 family [Sphingobacterium psychroaquaticum]